jgi:hypothetical protein
MRVLFNSDMAISANEIAICQACIEFSDIFLMTLSNQTALTTVQ